MARSEYSAHNDIASHLIGNIATSMHLQTERERFAKVLAKRSTRIAVRRSLIRRIFGI